MRVDPFIAFLAAAGMGLATSATAQERASFCDTGYLLGDENEDGMIGAAEVETLRESEFGALDANGDGTVTRDEFEQCMTTAQAAETAPRDVSLEGIETELEALSDGSLTRAEFMEAAEQAFDATRNEENNPIAWARNFIVLPPDDSPSEIAEMSREEFAARSAAMFKRLDADASGDLSTSEWEAEEPAAGESSEVDTAFGSLDEDDSGDVSKAEYIAAGSDQVARAREAAIARGWGEEGAMAGGVDAKDEESEGTGGAQANGLTNEGGALAAGDAAETGPAGAATDSGLTNEGGASAVEGASETGGSADARTGSETPAEGGSSDAAPVFDYRFDQG